MRTTHRRKRFGRGRQNAVAGRTPISSSSPPYCHRPDAGTDLDLGAVAGGASRDRLQYLAGNLALGICQDGPP